MTVGAERVRVKGALRSWPMADSFFGVVLAIDEVHRLRLVAFEDGSVDWYEFEGLEREG
jgi:hypothetical protein